MQFCLVLMCLYMYDVSSVMKAGKLDVCGYDSVMSDEAGDSSGVEVILWTI